MKKIAGGLLLSLLIAAVVFPLGAQSAVVLTGQIKSSVTGEGVDFAQVVLVEASQKVYTDETGNYTFRIAPGTYTLMVSSDTLAAHRETLSVTSNMTHDISLDPVSVSGGSITITGDRKQKISRRTMTAEELDEVPASFGDSVTALASLPGVIQSGGSGSLFGPLTIRGASPSANRYYVDGMPIQYPQHYGGMHSVLSNDFMSSVDLYASAYPAKFRGDNGAIIEINTLDEVDRLSLKADISLLSSAVMVQTPTYRQDYSTGEARKVQSGYFIASGRVGYISLLVPVFYELATDEELDYLPNYWDYQVKYKQNLTAHNSLTFMFIGAKDWWDIVIPDDWVDETIDPLFADFEFDTDTMFHNQMVSWNYSMGKLSNTLMAYAVLPYYRSYQSLNAEAATDALKDYEVTSMPFEFTAKDSFSYEWWKRHGELSTSLEYTNYRFNTRGDTIVINENLDLTDYGLVYGENSLITKESIDETYVSNSVGGHLENQFSLGGLTFVPQVRMDYLDRADALAVDPRGRVSYEFASETTLMAASGLYHNFNQINPDNFQYNPEQAADGSEIAPERSVHNSVGIEQKFGLFTLSTEGYYNYFYDMLVQAPYYEDGKYIWAKNIGEKKNYGAEVMVSKDSFMGSSDYFGWVSYTYLQSKYRSNLSLEEDDTGNGSRWINSEYEQEHTLKLVLGYRRGKHTFSGKFQLFSSMPYTAIVGSEEDLAYAAWAESVGSDSKRYVPVYSDDINGEHTDVSHQLDLRYSYQTSPKWGKIKWYIECINVYGLWYHPDTGEEWSYQEPYSSSNPTSSESSGLSTMPNFGVEISF